jgi:hypothetical protein
MTWQAKRAQVIEIALSAAFCHRTNVIGIPQGAPAVHMCHPVERKSGRTVISASFLQSREDGYSISLAEGADAMIAGEDLIAQVSRIRTQTVLMHAVVRAEGTPPPVQNLKLTPAAQRQAVHTLRQFGALQSSAWHGAGEHGSLRIPAPRQKRECKRVTAPGTPHSFNSQ